MKISIIRTLKKADIVILAVFTLFNIYLYAGFFFPDPYILAYTANSKKILWGIWILYPLVFLGILWLYINVRAKKIEPKAVLVLSISSAICLFLCYAAGDIYYQHWFDKHRKQFHPYLQLMPNDFKMRGDETASTIKIFCLGGSTTEIPDKSGIDWPSRVEKILRAKYKASNVEVFNLGRQWYTSLHTLINYETNLRRYKPSVLLIMQSVNDLLHNADFSYFSRGPFRDDYGHFYGPLNRIIDRRSLWRYLSDEISRLWYYKPRKIVTTSRFPGLQAYIRNINTIIELAKHDGTRVILMTEPSIFKKNMSTKEISAVSMLKVEAINDTMAWSIETVTEGMRQYNNALKKIAQEQNLYLIDLDKYIPKDLKYFHDEVHYNDITFPIVAESVAKELNSFLEKEKMKQTVYRFCYLTQ